MANKKMQGKIRPASGHSALARELPSFHHHRLRKTEPELSVLRPVQDEQARRKKEKLARALHKASFDGNLSAIKKAIQNGAEVNSADEYNSTPLHAAAGSRSPEAVRILLEAGAKLNAKDKAEGWTPIFWAAFTDNAGIVKLMLDYGKEHGMAPSEIVNAKDSNGWTPLAWAKLEHLVDMQNLLISYGARNKKR